MAWTQSGNIKGASGQPGASGVPGATGPAGPTGATGASGGTGGTGGPGTTTWAGITDKPGAILNYKGTWNASTNASPTLSDSTGSGGDVYRVSVAASRNLGSGTISWEIGDYAIYSPVTSSWEKADTTDAVSSVAGRTGAVTLTSADLGASGTPSASTFLRGDNTWAAGPIGATGASGGTGATGGTGAAGVNYSRIVQTTTAPTTLGASGATDYVVFVSNSGNGDIDYSTVLSLLHFNGSNGSTTFTCTASTPKTWTATGSAALSTTQKKFGTASLAFANGDRISSTSNSYAFAGNNFTLEAWIYVPSVTTTYTLFATRSTNATVSGTWSMGVYANAGIYWYDVGLTNGGTLTTNTWTHIAASRSGSTLRLFINGSLVATNTSYSQSPNTSTIWIGALGDGNEATSSTVYVDDFRVSQTARYTAVFTAPSAEFSDTTGTIGTPTLPSATGNTSRYSFRNTTGSAITIGASGSQAINGATGGLSLAASASTELMSDGTGWYSF